MVSQKQIDAARIHRAAQLREQLMVNMFSADSGVMGVNGMLGPRGDTGVSGHPGPTGVLGEQGIPMEKYILCYAGLHFEVWLKPATFAMIADATQVTGDELEFIKVIDQKEWEKIREMWCAEWHKRLGHKAFKLGLYEEFEVGEIL